MSFLDPDAADAAASSAYTPASTKPPLRKLALNWSGEDLRFEGGPEGTPAAVVDSRGKAGPSPTDHLLLAFAGCMGVDLVDILKKSRVPLEQLQVDVVGRRAPDPPRRFTSIVMTFRLSGPRSADRPKVERALSLSRETYCSVLHTLRSDLDITLEIRLD